jgi:hypothetical protein
MRFALALALSCALPACASVQSKAEEEWYPHSPTGVKEYGREGGYGAFGGLLSFENFDTSGTGIDAGNSDLGFSARGGWRTAEGLAVEGFLEYIPGYDLDVTVPGFGTVSEDLKIWNIGFAGKYYVGHEKVQPYALFGLGWARAEVDNIDVDDSAPFVRFGAGSDFYVTKDVGVFFELDYDVMTGDLDDLNHWNGVLGLVFRF